MFLRSDLDLGQSGGTSAASLVRSPPPPLRLTDRIRDRFPEFEIAPDLGSRIGSAEWYRGAATCGGLIALTVLLSPGFERPIYGGVPAALTGAAWEEARAQSIAPIAFGSTTGHRMGATSLVAPLADTPERPIIEIPATIGAGDQFVKVLRRAGVSAADADSAAKLVAGAVDLGGLASGTRLDLTLGRRTDKSQPRPLEKIAFRARFDLALEVVRTDGSLALNSIPIAIDHTPLRIRGRVGSSLYRSARAAGAPAKAIETFLRSIATRMSVGSIDSDAEFDLIVERARAETGETRMGQLMFAGISSGGRKVQLVRWGEGKGEWFDINGRGETRGVMTTPVNGRTSSGFGMRRHPVLGYARMHKGQDFAAPYGAPIKATADGRVVFAGRAGGYGNFVRINHGNGLGTGYGHMSRIAVRNGTPVKRGQVIGYVGSTGLSTGPHLHYELYRNGAAVNPRSVSFSTTKTLGGSELSAFRARVARLMAVPAGGTTAGAKPDAD